MHAPVRCILYGAEDLHLSPRFLVRADTQMPLQIQSLKHALLETRRMCSLRKLAQHAVERLVGPGRVQARVTKRPNPGGPKPHPNRYPRRCSAKLSETQRRLSDISSDAPGDDATPWGGWGAARDRASELEAGAWAGCLLCPPLLSVRCQNRWCLGFSGTPASLNNTKCFNAPSSSTTHWDSSGTSGKFFRKQNH